MREQTIFKPLLVTVSSLLIWAAHFTLIYGVTSLACERALIDTRVLGMAFVPFAISLATLVAVLGLGIVAAMAFLGHTPNLPDASNERSSQFLRKMTLTLCAISLLAVVLQTIPAFIVPACA